jgi:glycerol-3-phosphate acyltransferase PlsY
MAGYLAGSIPFGLIFSKLFDLGDIRNIGSGNIGATNVLRTGNKTAAILTLLMDALKGFLVVWFSSKYFSLNDLGMYAIGLAAIIGHIWPLWLRFSGGKGVATALGVYLAWHPLLALTLVSIWLTSAKLSQISSLSTLIALSSAPFIAFIFSTFDWADPLLAKAGVAVALLIIYTHRDNLKRLLSGQEGQIKI